MPLQIRTFLVGDDQGEITKWAKKEDELCPEYEQYYQEDKGETQFFDIDLSKFGGNGTNGTFA